MKIKEDLMFIKGNLSGLIFLVEDNGISDCLEMLIENIDDILEELEVKPLEEMEPKFEGKVEGFRCATDEEAKQAIYKVMNKYKGALEGLGDK